MHSSGQGGKGAGRRILATYADHSTLSLATAALVVDEACRAVNARGRFCIALAGGSTPASTYRYLAADPFAEVMPWEYTEVFWTDERCVDPQDPRSNERMVREALLDHVPIQADRVHPMRCLAWGRSDPGSPKADSAAAAQACAQEYDRLLTSLFSTGSRSTKSGGNTGGGEEGRALDLVLLGVGADGHTASLFPGGGVLQGEQTTTALFVEETANATTTAGDRDLWRVTMTASFINRAACVVFLASGAAKASAVKAVLEGEPDPGRLPAQLIDPGGILRWHLDEEAAALLGDNREGG